MFLSKKRNWRVKKFHRLRHGVNFIDNNVKCIILHTSHFSYILLGKFLLALRVNPLTGVDVNI